MIRVENLVKTFGEVRAVDGVSFHVQPGEVFAFLGPNGAGKTTTIQMLTTLLRPTSGTMALDGLDPVTHAIEVRRRFGMQALAFGLVLAAVLLLTGANPWWRLLVFFPVSVAVTNWLQARERT